MPAKLQVNPADAVVSWVVEQCCGAVCSNSEQDVVAYVEVVRRRARSLHRSPAIAANRPTRRNKPEPCAFRLREEERGDDGTFLLTVRERQVNESERLAAVRRYNILDTPPDGAFDRITAIAACLLKVPIAIISIVDHDRIWFKSRAWNRCPPGRP